MTTTGANDTIVAAVELRRELAERNVGPTRTSGPGCDFIVTFSDGSVFRIQDDNKHPVEALAAIQEGETDHPRRPPAAIRQTAATESTRPASRPKPRRSSSKIRARPIVTTGNRDVTTAATASMPAWTAAR
jgi:hypothetical protein